MLNFITQGRLLLFLSHLCTGTKHCAAPLWLKASSRGIKYITELHNFFSPIFLQHTCPLASTFKVVKKKHFLLFFMKSDTTAPRDLEVKCRFGPLLFLFPNIFFEYTYPLSLTHKEGPIQKHMKSTKKLNNQKKKIVGPA